MIIRHPDQVTPSRLTEMLKRAQVLERGEVVSVKTVAQSSEFGYVSHIARLEAVYSVDATGNPPRRLFLKMSKPELHPEILAVGAREVSFYSAIMENPGDFPIPHCYDAYYDPETSLAHVLMDDLLETHFQKPLPIPPSEEHCRMIVTSLARLHAYWWEDNRLGTELGAPLDAEALGKRRQRLEDTLPGFMDFLGDALMPFQRLIYERIFTSSFLSRYEQRLIQKIRITLTHGDAHTGNFLLPHDTESDQAIVIDWHLWDIGLGTNDLAFLMALHWGRERRAWLEKVLVERYHQELISNGVEAYDWEDCWQDYRMMVILMPLVSIGQFRRDQPPGTIWFGLQNSTAAFEDLECAELI